MARAIVLCFTNGNIAVFVDNQQLPEAQHPWLLGVAETLKKAGVDPLDAEITLPDGTTKARFVSTEDGGLNWLVGSKKALWPEEEKA